MRPTHASALPGVAMYVLTMSHAASAGTRRVSDRPRRVGAFAHGHAAHCSTLHPNDAPVVARPNARWLDRCRGCVIPRPVAWACGGLAQCCIGDRVRRLDWGGVESRGEVSPSGVRSRTRDLPPPCVRRVPHGLSAPIPGARWRPVDRYAIPGVQCGLVDDVCPCCLGPAPTSPACRADRALPCVGWGRRQWHRPSVARGSAARLFSRSLDSTVMSDRRDRAVASTLHNSTDSLRPILATGC